MQYKLSKQHFTDSAIDNRVEERKHSMNANSSNIRSKGAILRKGIIFIGSLIAFAQLGNLLEISAGGNDYALGAVVLILATFLVLGITRVYGFCVWMYKSHKTAQSINPKTLPWNPWATVLIMFIPIIGTAFLYVSIYRISTVLQVHKNGMRLCLIGMVFATINSILPILAQYQSIIQPDILAFLGSCIGAVSVILILTNVYIMNKAQEQISFSVA